MATTIVNPTSNTTPDPDLGGLAVTTPANTGHASSVSAAAGSGSNPVTRTKSCLWTAFPAALGTPSSVTLKVGISRTGSTSDAFVGTSNRFLVEYSLNGGSSWTALRDNNNFTDSVSTTDTAALLTSQDLEQVLVRDLISATKSGTESASATATVSDIRIEVVTPDVAPGAGNLGVSGMM